MATILAAIGSKVVLAILSAIAGWVAKMVHGWYTNVEQNKQAADQAQQSVQPLKDANPNDGKAIDDASDSALGGL